MRRLLWIAILVVAGYFAYTELLPRYRAFESQREAAARDDEETAAARACVEAAEAVHRDFGPALGRYARRPTDAGGLSTFLIQLSGSLSSADSACSCPGEACLSARAAMLEMRKLLESVDARVRSKVSGSADPAQVEDRIERLLARARAEAG